MFHFSRADNRLLRIDFQKKCPGAIKYAKVGLMSPHGKPVIKNPTYKQVRTGQSGHVEVIYLELDDPQKHFEELCRFFFTFHDPTLKNRQGNGPGFQYSSWMFCDDDEQFEIAKKVKEQLQGAIDLGTIKALAANRVEMQLCPLREFSEAHAEY